MIVRTWHGIVPAEKADGFLDYLLNTGVAEAKAYWESIDSIRSFAGPKPHVAVTCPEDGKYGLISDPSSSIMKCGTYRRNFRFFL
jgi:hypothetical protein